MKLFSNGFMWAAGFTGLAVAMTLCAALSGCTPVPVEDTGSLECAPGEDTDLIGWGPQNHGLQMWLAAEHNDWREGETPSSFTAHVRNKGKKEWKVYQSPVVLELELDGVWYFWSGEIDAKSSSLPPGRQYYVSPIRLVESWHEFKKDTPLKLSPGKHTLRVVFSAFPLDDDAQAHGIKAISNPVEFEIVPKNAATFQEFRRTWGRIKSSGRYAEGIKKMESIAARTTNRKLAAWAHYNIIECLVRMKDVDAAIQKAKWIAKTYPECPAQQWSSFGFMARTEVEEWKRYITRHPIPMKRMAMYRIAGLYWRSGQYDKALKIYNRILATVPPDPLPDTLNSMIVETAQVHKGCLGAKHRLLKKMGRFDEARKVAELQEKLYPAAAWRDVELAADKARESYFEESKELNGYERAAEFEKLQKLEDEARQQREAERAGEE